mmetsp:Transcript_32015/g.23667  ORF Transcript_32015/g.23667 Transcript_32015/m.23667 type:complete len:87 (+) Transcript_32015:324-584(+)|eukprot:CAMPEP_0202959806 /NCGR_PEP_ID=MMETSP1396-20130829/3989_1 /ASSEMBLY_ACC=CAM_ASM_000872 /TAXON_ID= /ORGANISM="Pseudokeronopsis sp., Strain Brazil" /LENGTH=86 /DNA_ID=CAMNT_0049678597 /DNA_START=299 /DNA_END=559 /DNA_ORIENTATION=-
MKALAKGKDEEVITSMIKHLINSTQGNQFETYLDDSAIRDIAQVVEGEIDLGDPAILSQSHAIQVKDKKEIKIDEEDDDIDRAPAK